MPVTSYNRYSRYLHWLMAGLILFMVFLGWRLDAHDSMRLSRVNLHKSVGILILLLSFVRLGLRLAYKAPPEVEGPKWQTLAAKTLHVGFYVLMIGLPLSGWAMVSTSAREIPFFGLFPWPHLPVTQSHDTHELFETIHGLLAKLIIYAMIPLHIGAALKHHFVDKDAVMSHMVPGLTPKPVANWRWIVPVGVAVVAIATANLIYQGVPEQKTEGHEGGHEDISASETVEVIASESAPPVASASSPVSVVPVWIVDKAATQITFAAGFSGETVKGGFSNYATHIEFDPAQLEKSHVRVTIDLASLTTGNGDYDSTLKSDSFFNIGQTPKAIFEASSFTKTDKTHYVAKGKLTLHGVTKPLNMPFSLAITGKQAQMSGHVDIDRTAFGVGSGDYAGTNDIPAKVAVTVSLKAHTN